MTPSEQQTFECAPTLTNLQVLDFCRNGYLVLEGVVEDDVNQRVTEFLDTYDGSEPSEILAEDWFVEAVLMNPAATGALRSLLGANFHMPVLMSNHRVLCPVGAQQWHVDGNYNFTLELNNLQVFYLPQDTPVELAPTQLLPGSHLLHNKARHMDHYGGIRGQISTSAPAGSIFLTAYHIWHRRGPGSGSGLRNMLKYFYWRTTPPCRDWIVDPGLDFATLNYACPIERLLEQFRGNVKVAKLFLWLCGYSEAFQNLGGQSWPMPANRSGAPYGLPAELPVPQKE